MEHREMIIYLGTISGVKILNKEDFNHLFDVLKVSSNFERFSDTFIENIGVDQNTYGIVKGEYVYSLSCFECNEGEKISVFTIYLGAIDLSGRDGYISASIIFSNELDEFCFFYYLVEKIKFDLQRMVHKDFRVKSQKECEEVLEMESLSRSVTYKLVRHSIVSFKKGFIILDKPYRASCMLSIEALFDQRFNPKYEQTFYCEDIDLFRKRPETDKIEILEIKAGFKKHNIFFTNHQDIKYQEKRNIVNRTFESIGNKKEKNTDEAILRELSLLTQVVKQIYKEVKFANEYKKNISNHGNASPVKSENSPNLTQSKQGGIFLQKLYNLNTNFWVALLITIALAVGASMGTLPVEELKRLFKLNL